MSVKWDKLFEIIGGLSVTMPDPQPGEPLDLEHLRDLAMLVVQKRNDATKVYQRLTQKVAVLKRDVRVLKEALRIAKIQALSEPEIRTLRTKREREMAVEEMTVAASGSLAIKEGKLAEWESALSAVDMQIKGLEQQKQVFNTLVKLTLADLKLSGDLPDVYRL